MGVIRRRNGQRGLWEVLPFGDLEPRKQLDPRLRRIDEVVRLRPLPDGPTLRAVFERIVQLAAVPKPGHQSPSWLKRERQRTFRKARAWRAGGEARIARLKNTFGMRRTR